MEFLKINSNINPVASTQLPETQKVYMYVNKTNPQNNIENRELPATNTNLHSPSLLSKPSTSKLRPLKKIESAAVGTSLPVCEIFTNNSAVFNPQLNVPQSLPSNSIILNAIEELRVLIWLQI